ncbi:MAG: DUF2934 domain-containing protein [Luteitalea sp.]|nr:DUF2934 domain-containing protein [Luteitalea sp.]
MQTTSRTDPTSCSWRGWEPGHDLDDWLQAERELNGGSVALAPGGRRMPQQEDGQPAFSSGAAVVQRIIPRFAGQIGNIGQELR